MSATAPFNEDQAHRWFGVEFNNAIFPLLQKTDRSDDETEEMISLAHAALLHWSRYSGHTAANRARGENMIATAYAYAGRRDEAMRHARRNLDIVQRHPEVMEEFDQSYALMAMARAYALAGDYLAARPYYDKCAASIAVMKDAEDKKICESDLHSGPWYGLMHTETA